MVLGLLVLAPRTTLWNRISKSPTKSIRSSLSLSLCYSSTSSPAGSGSPPPNDNILRPTYRDPPSVVIHETLPEIITWNLARWATSPAFECGLTGQKYSHGQVHKLSLNFATALLQSGLKRNDVVGVILPNIPEYPIVLLGIWWAGLIATPACPNLTTNELKPQLTQTGAKTVITIPSCVPQVEAIKNSAGSRVKSIIVISHCLGHEGTHSFFEMIKYHASTKGLLHGSSGFDARRQIAVIPFSAGISGLPKGVVLSHSNLATNLLQIHHPDLESPDLYDGIHGQERNIGIIPFCTMYGLTSVLNSTLYRGHHCVTMSVLNEHLFTKIFKRCRPTHIALDTRALNLMVESKEFDKETLDTLHTLRSGSGPIARPLLARLREKANKFILIQKGYGMTETSPATLSSPNSVQNHKLGSVGVPIPWTLAKIVDPKTGETLGPNQNGELLVQGPQVMREYWKDPGATKEIIDYDGWLHTGDECYHDQEGYVYVVGRFKELIKVRGYQVSPPELESVLKTMPGILDCAVVGIETERGELPRAFVVPKKDDLTLTQNEIHGFMKRELAIYKQLTGGIEFVKEIPRCSEGKTLKSVLEQMYSERKQRGL